MAKISKIKHVFSWFPQHKKQTAVVVVLILAVLLVRPFGILGNSGAQNYKTVALAKSDLTTSINVSGQVTADNLATMSFLTAGRVSWVGAKEGDQVTNGQVIATLDNTAVQANIIKAQDEVKSAKTSLDKVLDDIHLSQYGNGGFSNVGSANETQTQKTAREQAEATLNSANQDLKIAQQQQQLYSIIAPFDGVISEMKGIAVGQNVGPTSGSSVTVVGDGKLKFVANVDETEYGQLKLGQAGDISLDAFPNEKFTGQITKFGASAIKLPTGGSVVPVEISLPDDSRLKNGLNGEIEFSITSKNNVLVLPRSAVKKDTGGQYVYLQTNKQPVRQSVTTGDSLGTKVEITTGLKEGDVVILSEVKK